MVDYAVLADTANRLITANGRSVTLSILDKTPADAAKPWRGPADPRSSETTKAVTAAFVPPSGLASLGFAARDDELVKRADEVALASLGSGDTTDLTLYNELVEGSDRWRISQVMRLKPGAATVLYAMVLNR